MTPIRQDPHNRPGHLNVYSLDQQSEETGYGTHARVVAFHPEGKDMYIRVDLPDWIRGKWDAEYPALPEPTAEQIIKVAKKVMPGDVRGRWYVKSKDVWPSGESIDYVFTSRKPKSAEGIKP